MSKNLIFYICFGGLYHREMTAMSILSIIDNTNFSGDIVILTDEIGINHAHTKIRDRVCQINIFDKKPELREVIKNKFNVYCIKAMIYEFINISNYQYILYLDADTIINIKDIESVMLYWKVLGKIQIATHEGWTVAKNRPSTGSQFLTDEEKERWSSLGFCAGVIGIPCNELGLEFLIKWNNLNSRFNYEFDDQGALTALLLRDFYDNYEICKFYNTDRWSFKDITHYHGNNKKNFWEHCKFLLKKYKISININGTWRMSKPCENLSNCWTFDDNLVYVDYPSITGTIQFTELGNYIWWNNFDGFEKLNIIDSKNIYGDSFKGGFNSFTLKME